MQNIITHKLQHTEKDKSSIINIHSNLAHSPTMTFPKVILYVIFLYIKYKIKKKIFVLMKLQLFDYN